VSNEVRIWREEWAENGGKNVEESLANTWREKIWRKWREDTPPTIDHEKMKSAVGRDNWYARLLAPNVGNVIQWSCLKEE